MKKTFLFLFLLSFINFSEAGAFSISAFTDCYDEAEAAVGIHQGLAIGRLGMGEPLSYEEEYEIFSQIYDSCYEDNGSDFYIIKEEERHSN